MASPTGLWRRPGSGKGMLGGYYRPLSQEQVERIHEASLVILANTGFHVEHAEARQLFLEAGAEVDGRRVTLPRSLVEEAVEKAPSRILLAGRDRINDLILEGNRVHLGTGGAALQVLDLETGRIRSALLRDVADIARLVDALDNIHFYVIPVTPTDLPEEQVEGNKFYAALSNTSKHVQAGVSSIKGIREVIEFSERIVAGTSASTAQAAKKLRERPIVSFITSWMVSPLTFSSPVTDLLVEICRHRMPVVLSASPMAGSTAPVTLAGMLAQLNAEQLAGLTLTQLVSTGQPVLVGPIPATTDLRSGKYLGGSVEMGLCNAAMTQMAHFYKVPIYNSAGMTEAKLPDIQAGMEKAQSVMQVALAGANFIHHAAGMLEDTATIAYEQYVIDNEMLGAAMRAVRGIRVDDETLAMEAIQRVGPGGNYLTDEHTLRFMRSEHFDPSPVFDRKKREMWEREGSTDASSRAKAVVRLILAEHEPTRLDPQVAEWIQSRYALRLDWQR